MKFIIQVVSSSSVTVDKRIVGQIQKGLNVLIGIGNGDTKEIADKMIQKMLKIRIFPDSHGKTNLSITDINGSLLLIPQFTLYANIKRGNRPSFTDAEPPTIATQMFDYIVETCKHNNVNVQSGIFGSDMTVNIVNEGPFTIILDSTDLQ